MTGGAFPEPQAQPAEVPARLATARVPAGRMPAGRAPATKMAASGVPASPAVLRRCGREKTDHRQQDRKYTRSLKEGNSSGHALPTPGNPIQVYSGSGRRITLQCGHRIHDSALELLARFQLSDRSPMRGGTSTTHANAISQRWHNRKWPSVRGIPPGPPHPIPGRCPTVCTLQSNPRNRLWRH